MVTNIGRCLPPSATYAAARPGVVAASIHMGDLDGTNAIDRANSPFVVRPSHERGPFVRLGIVRSAEAFPRRVLRRVLLVGIWTHSCSTSCSGHPKILRDLTRTPHWSPVTSPDVDRPTFATNGRPTQGKYPHSADNRPAGSSGPGPKVRDGPEPPPLKKAQVRADPEGSALLLPAHRGRPAGPAVAMA
jgi:hypothetical protein